MLPFLILLVLLAAVAVYGYWQLRRRGLRRWLGGYLLETPRRRVPRPDEEVHLLLCFADHFEPKANRASPPVAAARVQYWVQQYPRQFGHFRDSDGRPPRYTFFYPIEEYEPAYLDALAELCRAGFGEVEIHLHHDQATADQLARSYRTSRNCWRIGTACCPASAIRANWLTLSSTAIGRCATVVPMAGCVGSTTS